MLHSSKLRECTTSRLSQLQRPCPDLYPGERFELAQQHERADALPAAGLPSVAEGSVIEESTEAQTAVATAAAAAVRNATTSVSANGAAQAAQLAAAASAAAAVPAHVAAAQSIAAQSTLAATNLNGHGGQRHGSGRLGKFIDRMPCRARGRPLPKVFRVLMNKGVSKPWEREATSAERDEYVWLRAEQSVTSWGDGEKAHPINFFEQSIECEHCGCWRFPTTPAAKCCQNGRLVLNQRYRLGSELLDLAARGVSKVSRSLNNGYRFAQMRLPKDSHWVCDSYQHLKITGMPFAMVNNLNEASSTRSFLDDPLERQARTARVPVLRGGGNPTVH